MKTTENKKTSINKIIQYILLVVLILLVGFLMSKYLNFYQECKKEYSFINPIFACLEKITIDKKEYIDLRLRLTSFIENEKIEGRVNLVGVFFRDLNAGPTFGINDRTDFIPASLLKLPHVLTLMRLSEEELPNLLSQKLMYTDESLLINKQEFPPEETIQPNISYTVEELMERTMKYSDNIADELLVEHINSLGNGVDLVAETYRDLGILSDTNIDSSSVNAKSYSSIFRMLYNSSFLNKKNSEELLRFLSEDTFNIGLKNGLPQNIKVADKFGERTIDATGEKQLHDCGIIYYPNNPYLLCVMTKGKDFKDLEKIISYISSEVYKEVDSRKVE